MKFISTKYAVYMAMMPDLPHPIGPRPIILSGVVASNMGDAECPENGGFGSTCDILRGCHPRPELGVERKQSGGKPTSASECRLLGDKQTYRRNGSDFRV